MKRTDDKKLVDGVQYWWCPHHKREGFFDGLYMPHDPNNGHAEWQRRKDERKQKSEDKKTGGGGNSNAPSGGTSQSLTLNENMKRVLMTRFGCSEDAASNAFSEMSSHLND